MSRRAVRILPLLLAAMLLVALSFAGCGSGYRITIAEGDEDLVVECPKRAEAGETVVVETVLVEDADLYVSVNGDNEFGRFTSDGVYEFVMPEEDVEINVTIISNGLA